MADTSADEALQHLDELCDLMPTWRVQSENARGARALSAIRSALELAAREQRAWAKIEAWCAAFTNFGCGYETYIGDDHTWCSAFTNGVREPIESFEMPSRLECLEAAAAWAEKEMGK